VKSLLDIVKNAMNFPIYLKAEDSLTICANITLPRIPIFHGAILISLSWTAQPKALRKFYYLFNTGLYSLFLSEFVLYRQSDQPHILAECVLSNIRGIRKFIINT
jgi:hypothetical protein